MSQIALPPPKLQGGPYVMGVLNVTPDSFSDGGLAGDAGARGLAMIEAGADIIDVGGESTRPGAEPVSEAEEIARVAPAIAALRAAGPVNPSAESPAAAVAAAVSGFALQPAGESTINIARRRRQ